MDGSQREGGRVSGYTQAHDENPITDPADEPAYIRRGIMRITGEALLTILEYLSTGRLVMPDDRVITLTGMPLNCRLTGIRLEHWGDHIIDILLEGPSFPVIFEGDAPPTINPIVEIAYPESPPTEG